MKFVVFLGDGMADWPVPALGGKTPLAFANHPAMDRLASDGLFGLANTIPDGMTPGSDTANLAVFGYDPRQYYTGRSPLEAVSIGVPLDDADVTYRCNLVTLSDPENLDDAVMTDYSAGEITSEEARPLVAAMNEAFADERVRLYAGFSYRNCLVLKNAGTGAILMPPHDISGQRIRDHLPAGANDALLTGMFRFSCRTLKDHPVNLARAAEGKRPANAVWFWGEGRKPKLPSFAERFGVRGAVVSAVDLIQGIGVCAGLAVLRVPGATGTYATNFAGKGEAAVRALKSGSDFVYIHVEAPDECGHHGQLPEKVYSIEQIDDKIMRPVMDYLDSCGEDYAVLLMPDHPTPIELMTHTSDPVPFALYRRGDHARRSARYCEDEAARTGVLVPEAHRLLPFLFGMEKNLH